MKHIIVVIAAAVAACSSSDSPSDGPQPVAWPERAYVEQLVPRFDALARQRIESVAVADALRARLTAEAKRPWAVRVQDGLKYADLLLAVYESVDWTLSFATGSGPTPRAVGVLARLERSPEDALDNSAYHLEAAAIAGDTLTRHPVPPAPSLALDPAEVERAVQWLERHDTDLADPATLRRLVDAMLGLDGEPLAPRLFESSQRYRDEASAANAALVELELHVADGVLRFARDMRHFNYRRLSWAELERRGGGKRVVYDRLEDTLRQLFQASDADAADEVLTELRPNFEQYDRLLTALATYRELPDWESVSAQDAAATPDKLRARLAIEGHDAIELEEAIASYQTTHQFAHGVPDPGFWRSLNVPRARRVAQIELTLARYRESFYRDELDYVFVNIPDFHAEVYADGVRKMRIPVVVGNTERVCDPTTQKWRYPNATPIQWAPLEHLMLNPWWNVPPRLFTEEIAPHVDEPGWLEARGYELFEQRGATQARQRPGPKNALGLVKFIFPNEHDTYMHDTPSKQYFALPVRAFSHGCVRVQEPLALAEHFMTHYDLGGTERLERIIELGSTIRIDIPGAIPVFFEYYTVRVDDEGRTWFLADPYRHDEVRLTGPDALSCTPRAAVQPEDLVADETPPVHVDDQGP